MNKPLISVIIPSYNSSETLELCIEAVTKQKTRHPYEIIVVDCSDTDKEEYLCRQYASVFFIKKQHKFTPGIGRNIGAAHAQGVILVFVDADVLLKDDALEKISHYYNMGYQVFSGALELSGCSNGQWMPLLEHAYFNHESQKHRCIGRRKNLSSALMVVDRAVFCQNKGFRDIPRMQDTEMTERLNHEGIKLYFIPYIVAYQIQNTTLKKLFFKIWITGNNLYFIRYAPHLNYFKKATLFFMLPGLAFFKITRIILRNLYFMGFPNKARVFFLIPVLYLCGSIWMGGFYSALFRNKGVSQNR
ncbi:glycosyl transferase family 2 [Nitrosococcus halophilus Nc 4]|uniref:Glycosyl transferase family 2 n=1 Tax=Nitrosococcus halophilus (strain Nc4) TaxID=472759 RepID=D5C0N6_NITHN|nr:glycosyltransferase [Nitrosococcus halophilus]ADE16359.1 glycosyl transferase family 2 [Nitrosococcus halophilus Nc 4]